VTGGQSKPLFLRGPSLNTRLFFCALLSVVLMTMDHRQNQLENLRAALSVLVHPVQWAVDAPFRAASWASSVFIDRATLVLENRTLRDDAREAAVRLQRFATLEAENRRLRALLNAAETRDYQVEVVTLLSVDLDPFRHQVVIDRGEQAGVTAGQALIDALGVMGQVHRVGPLSAHAVLITDPSHSIPVEVNRNGLRSIARGTGELDRLDLPFLPNNADIEVGDLLVTSGLGGVFPSGYPVARVTRVTRRPGERFAQISATPVAELNRSREVLLVHTGETP
jgi:rod shape-determining protein MreC